MNDWGGRAAQTWVAQVLRTHGTVCHLCRHGGADSGDHIRPRSTHPELAYDPANGLPVHHEPCPVCHIRCNIRRKDKPLTAAPPIDETGFFERTP